jgi:hypothetical protein
MVARDPCFAFKFKKVENLSDFRGSHCPVYRRSSRFHVTSLIWCTNRIIPFQGIGLFPPTAARRHSPELPASRYLAPAGSRHACRDHYLTMNSLLEAAKPARSRRQPVLTRARALCVARVPEQPRFDRRSSRFDVNAYATTNPSSVMFTTKG